MSEMRLRSLCLESLEPRLPLAGMVTAAVVEGDLVMEGDAEYNDVDILAVRDGDSIVAGAYEIRGDDGTSINIDGQYSVVLPGVTADIVVNMPEGGYRIYVGDDINQRTPIPGDFRAYSGLDKTDGDNSNIFRLEGADVAGDVFVKTDPGGHYNVVSLSYAAVTGSVTVEAGRKLDRVSLFRSQVGGDFNVTGMLGEGPVPKKITHKDRTDIYISEVGGSVSITGVPGSSQHLKVDRSQITGDFSFAGGPGYDRVILKGTTAGELNVTTGTRRDWFTLEDTAVDKLYASLGAGTDLVELVDTTVDTSATVMTGSGHDVVGVMGLAVTDHFRLNTAEHRDIVFLGSNPSYVAPSPVWWQINQWELPIAGMGLTAGSASISTGSGNDWMQLQKSSITLDTQVSTGTGNDWLQLYRTEIGGRMRLDSGGGSDVIDAIRCQVTGPTLILAGGGNDKLRAIGNQLSGDLAVNMGAGKDVLTANSNRVTGRARLSGGSEFDVLVKGKNVFGALQVIHFEKIK